MPDFLTRRGSTWHFVRRVPGEFAAVDPRVIVRHSTRIKITDDRTGRRAMRIANKLNDELERFWQSLASGRSDASTHRYDDARRRARALGYDYLDNAELIAAPLEKRLDRLESLVTQGAAPDATARAALLGTEKRPAFMLSRLFQEFEAVTRDEVKDLSPDQLRIWRNSRIRAVQQFVKVVGDKPINEISDTDGLDYTEWWRTCVVDDNVAAKSANRDIGQLSRMLKALSIRRRLGLPDVFKGLRISGEANVSRMPFDPEFIERRLLADGALAGLNEEARFVLYVMIETGLRPSEIVNLRSETIRLEAPIPHVRVMPDGRRLKTADSERDIPLVGVALAALKERPQGFPRYRDRASSLSATLNKYLGQHGLRPTPSHSVYSLRHSFKDRLVAQEAPDSLIDSLMGHKTYKPKYGRGPSLELKLKFLERSAFKVPDRL